MSILGALLSGNVQDYSWQIPTVGGDSSGTHGPTQYFSVIYIGVYYIYKATDKAAAIAGFEADPEFVGWSSLNGADNARIAYSTADGTVIGMVTNTFTTLKALAVPATAVVVLALGHNAINDGGGAFFLWNATDASADNGGTVIQPASAPATGRWNKVQFS